MPERLAHCFLPFRLPDASARFCDSPHLCKPGVYARMRSYPASVEAGPLAANLARKKSRGKFSAVKEARRRARQAVGLPPAERVIPDKRRKPPKHKKKIIEDELY